MAKPIGRLLLVGTCGALLGSLALVGCGGSSTARPGSGGTTGSAGTTGSGGSAAGTTGSGGSTGSAGTTGTAGAGGASASLSCAVGTAFSPTMALLTDFSSTTLTAAGTWGTPGNVTGHTFGYKGSLTSDGGAMSSVTASFDRTAKDLVLAGTVLPGDFAGGGMSFDQCVNTTAWSGIQFTLGGTAGGCALTFQLQTLTEEPPSNKGTCTAASCYAFPKVTIQIDSGNPITVTFADLANTGMPAAAADFEMQMFGLQWQFQSPPAPDGGVQVGCTPNMTIANVMFVP